MSSERLELLIKAKPGEAIRPTFFVSDVEEIKGAKGAAVRYWVVGENDSIGLKPGLYVQTNLYPEYYRSNPSVGDAIGHHVVLDLMDRSQKTASIGAEDGPHLDYSNAIELLPCAISENGAIILRLTSADPEQTKLKIKDVESGNTRMKFNPNTRTP